MAETGTETGKKGGWLGGLFGKKVSPEEAEREAARTRGLEEKKQQEAELARREKEIKRTCVDILRVSPLMDGGQEMETVNNGSSEAEIYISPNEVYLEATDLTHSRRDIEGTVELRGKNNNGLRVRLRYQKTSIPDRASNGFKVIENLSGYAYPENTTNRQGEGMAIGGVVDFWEEWHDALLDAVIKSTTPSKRT